MLKDLYLDSRELQTPNIAPIQCAVWLRNVFRKLLRTEHSAILGQQPAMLLSVKHFYEEVVSAFYSCR